MGSILQGASALLQSQEQASAMESQAAFAKDEAGTARAAASQDEAIRRRQLMSVLASQDAVRAGRGLSMTSGTALSLYGDTVGQAEKDIRTAKYEYLQRADRLRAQAQSLRSSAKTTRTSGYLSLSGGLIDDGSKLFAGM